MLSSVEVSNADKPFFASLEAYALSNLSVYSIDMDPPAICDFSPVFLPNSGVPRGLGGVCVDFFNAPFAFCSFGMEKLTVPFSLI